MDGLQHKHSHIWHGVIRPMEKQQAKCNKQRKSINKWAGEQGLPIKWLCGADTTPSATVSKRFVGMCLSPSLNFLGLLSFFQEKESDKYSA
jgi:hypothetical protein